MSITVFGVTLGQPGNLVVIVPLLLCSIAVVIYRIVRSQNVVKVLSSGAWHKHFLLNFSSARLYIKAILTVLGMVFLLFTLLHPQWNKKRKLYHNMDVIFLLHLMFRVVCSQPIVNPID